MRRARARVLALVLAVLPLLAGCAAPASEGPADRAPADTRSPFGAIDCTDAPPMPDDALPPPLECRAAPGSGAPVVRVGAAGARPEGASVSPANADGSLLLLYDDAAGGWVLVDGESGERVRVVTLTPAAMEPRWSPLDANGLYFLDGNALFRYDVAGASVRKLGEYANYSNLRTGGDGDFALLDSGHIKLALLATPVDGGAEEVLVLSVRERATFGRETVSSRAWRLPADALAPSSVRMTPDNYVVVVDSAGAHVHVSTTGERLRSVASAASVLDVCRAADGSLVVLGRRYSSGDSEVVSAYNAASSASWDVFAGAPGERVTASCRSTHEPGTFAAVAFSPPGSDARAGRVIVGAFAPDAAEPRVLADIGAPRESPSTFVPVAVADRNGERVLVLTNWGIPGAGAETFAIGVPAEWRTT